jgi:hypothetical protein
MVNILEKKTGKTTMFRDLINTYYKGDMSRGFLAGFESGFNAMDGLYAEKIIDWDDWEEYVEDFVENRKSLSYKFIAIDTIDYFVEKAIEKTLKESKKKDGKKVTSINEAFSGYGRGKEYCLKIMRESLTKLHDAGYGLFFIGHTKLKKKNTGVVLGDGQEYMQLSCSLTNDYASLFEDMADIISYLVVEKEVDSSITDAKQRTATDKVNIHFRSNGSIDCGGRFKDLPEKVAYSAENYLKAFEKGVKSSIIKPINNEQIKEIAIKQEEEAEKKAEELSTKATISEMVAKVKSEFSNLGDGAKIALQQLIEDANISSLDELNEEHRDIVEKMYELVV